MGSEPRIRVSALLRWSGRILLCRHEKPGKEYWLLPGRRRQRGETLVDALQRELAEEVGIDDDLPLEGPVAIVDSIAPGARASREARRPHHLRRRPRRPLARGGHLAGRGRARPPALRARASSTRSSLHPPIQRFLAALAARRPGRLPRRALGALDATGVSC